MGIGFSAWEVDGFCARYVTEKDRRSYIVLCLFGLSMREGRVGCMQERCGVNVSLTKLLQGRIVILYLLVVWG